MAKITVAGKAVIITSTLKLEDIKTVGKYRPKALSIYGGEDGKEEIFAIKAGYHPSFSKFGICFTDATREDKLATITIITNYEDSDVEGYVADHFGAVITHLNKLEETLPSIIEEIAAERASVINSITVID